MDDVANLEVRWIQGFTNTDVVFVDKDTITYVCGNHICFLNLETKIRSVLQSPGRGIGAFTANGNNRIFAFSDQKLFPSIFVYNFPDLLMKKELKGKVQLDYTSLALSSSGPYLASCSSYPDHSITIWNWENTQPLCTQSQAGQDVISLVFNPLNWLQLCALGPTSITIWTIEKSCSYHALKPSIIKLPATNGNQEPTSYSVSVKRPHLGPQMPASAVSGLRGDRAERILSNLCTEARLTPSAICWTATSQLYVGCAEGFLLRVDPESVSVSVLFNPRADDAIPELKQCNFQDLTICKKGLIVVGKDSLMHCLQVKETKVLIIKTWDLEASIRTLTCFPDLESLLLSSQTGQIYMLNPDQSDSVVKVVDVRNFHYVAAALLHTNKNICVLLTGSGELQLFSTDGIFLSSQPLRAQGTCLACCPVAQYAAVGTISGQVLFIDLNREQRPRLVHQVQLYHGSVDHLIFDPEGHYLLTGASDSHIYVLHAKPSKMFSVIGHTVISGSTLSLSVHCVRDCDQVDVLVLSSGQEDKPPDGRILTLLALPKRNHAGPACVDRHGRLSINFLKESRYEVSHPVNSCVLGGRAVFAYCHRRKSLQRFQLPQVTDEVSSEQMLQLQAEQEVKGHPLGPATLLLSPHQLWLASVGRDGLLRIRETASMERYIQLQCHSCRLGGVRTVSFSADCQILLTAGLKDGSVVCSDLRTISVDADKVKAAAWCSLSMAKFLSNVINKENLILTELPEVSEETDTKDVTAQCESEGYTSHLSASPSHPTWLERRHQAVIKEDNEQLSETKTNLRKTIKELRDTIQEMMSENENLPDIERLEQHEFNLDVEEQQRLEAMVEKEALGVRNEMEWEIVRKCYLHDVLKRECWDSIKVKGRAVEAFHSELKVTNFPMKERTEQEKEDLRRVENIRAAENAAFKQSGLEESSTTANEQKEEGDKVESTALSGSYSAQLGFSNPYIYDQFSLTTTEQKINQTILLQDTIYRIKMAFNEEFELVHKQKVQEVKGAKERNRHIRSIMLVLDMSEELWEPSLSNAEWPERMLTVDDSEIEAEKPLTPEQRREEERLKVEEAAKLQDKDMALHDMMDGVLEVKKVNILKMEIPPPEFVLTKSETDWTEEEKKAFREFQKKTNELNEEKEEYRKLLEAELKKLQAINQDGRTRLDETLKMLLKKKVKCKTAIYQEELKIAYLVYSVLTEEEMRNRELELKLKHERVLAYKDKVAGDLKRHEEELELFQEDFYSIVAEDKVLDKEFRKHFIDVPARVVDHLYKLFKRRPRVQKLRTQTEKNSSSFKEQRLCGSLAPDALGKMLKAMEELDAPENIPAGLNLSMWERFCLVRRTKVESEQKVKDKALTVAEMQAFLQKKREEEKAAQQEILNISDKLETLQKDKNRFQKDVMVQILLKQGQGEVPITDLTADYSESVLQHRSVVEDLNRTIRMLAEQKIASMVDCKDLRKGIIKSEWENKMRRMQIEDLNSKARDIQKLQLTEEQKDYLQNTNRDSLVSKQVSILEKTIDFQEKTHLQAVHQRIKKIEQLKRQAAKIAAKNKALDQQLPDIQVTVAERMHVYEEIASEANEAAGREERYQEILQKKYFENLARAQVEELNFYCAELERLRMKSFPSLDKLKHN